VRKEYEEADVSVEGVDYRAAVVYISTELERHEVVRAGLQKVVPKRLHRRG
jgi:hypothetical protein